MTKKTKSKQIKGTFWLKGKKVYLRPLEQRDASVLYKGINDPNSHRFLDGPLPKGLGFEEEWIKSVQKPDKTKIVVGICLIGHGEKLIGTMGLHNIDLINRTAITGSVIFAEKYRNKGYGTDAKMILLNHAFNELDLHLVESRVIAFNGRSAAYSAKCGYVEEARLRSRFIRFGERHDEIILSVTRETWLPHWEEYKKGL